jgi:hypothetical protein
MKVKAKFPVGKFGFYGGVRRRDGDVFEIESPKHFSEKWMVKIEDKPRRGRSPASETTETMDEGAE